MTKHTGKTVLIADDNDAGIRYLVATLKSYDVNIITAKNGQEAVDAYKENAIDMVLMDIGMPIMNGFDATREILKSDPEAVVIIQSAYTMNSEKEESIDSGAKEYLSKPVDRNKLSVLLDKWLKY